MALRKKHFGLTAQDNLQIFIGFIPLERQKQKTSESIWKSKL